MAVLKALKQKSCLSLGTCHKHVVQFKNQLLQPIGMSKELN